MSQPIHLSIDAMGGDQGPRLVVEASIAFLKRYPHTRLTLFGDFADLEAAVKGSVCASRISLTQTELTVAADERAGSALRHKQGSSMWKAVELVATGQADACVSGGNTGALMAMGRKLIKTFPGVSRPAICKPIPTARGSSFILDLGANLNCSAQQLVQFALMGSALARVYGCENPSVALLNVGTELSKGSESILTAAALMREHPAINFAGFVEGHGLYQGDVDVVVCDGLVGNVALKVSEGVAAFIVSSLKAKLRENRFNQFAGLIVEPLLRRWMAAYNPSNFNGAAMLGLQRTLVKSHGGTDKFGFEQALVTAVDQVSANIPERIAQCL
ncbi:phosphate acyltransferase PlsX [Teredinibacter turnerae]|uniref:phosphate acyltransferase PlsX n=1 Tax=Teredinibacter turnerae TaxID=2426 RepID=UPI0004198791|nr:phosphate acyltransferase PlsX [Teredinibacter turnerae]